VVRGWTYSTIFFWYRLLLSFPIRRSAPWVISRYHPTLWYRPVYKPLECEVHRYLRMLLDQNFTWSPNPVFFPPLLHLLACYETVSISICIYKHHAPLPAQAAWSFVLWCKPEEAQLWYGDVDCTGDFHCAAAAACGPLTELRVQCLEEGEIFPMAKTHSRDRDGRPDLPGGITN